MKYLSYISAILIILLCLALPSCSVWTTAVNTTITTPNSGAVYVHASGNPLPSGYLWSNGSTASSRTGLQASYTPYSLYAYYGVWGIPLSQYVLCEVNWIPIITNTANTVQLNVPAAGSLIPSSITKSSQSGPNLGFNASAYSTNVLPSNSDGFLEFQVGNIPSLSNLAPPPTLVVSSPFGVASITHDDFIMGLTPQYIADDPIAVSGSIQYGLHFTYTWSPTIFYIRYGPDRGKYRVFWRTLSTNVKVFYNGVDIYNAGPYRANDVYTIKKSSGYVTFTRNNTAIALPAGTYSNGLPINSLTQNLIVDLAANRVGMNLNYARTTFTDRVDYSNYAELAKELNGSFYVASHSLGLRYKEKYNNSTLNYKIYDWNRTVVNGTPVISNLNNGYNYITLNLSGLTLANAHFYVLEVTDRKGEVYKLRFQYFN